MLGLSSLAEENFSKENLN